MRHSVALVVHACDRYELLFNGFEFFFNKNWDFDIPCNLYIITEEIDANLSHFANVKSGKGAWSDRLRNTLAAKIKEEYILLFQEDMWLDRKVNGNFFAELFSIAEEKNLSLVKLHSSNIYKTESTDQFIQGFRLCTLRNSESRFLMSHQVSLWNKQFLISKLHKGEHPWRNERKGTKRIRRTNPKIYHLDYFAENNQEAINENDNPIGRSAYHTVSVNAVLNQRVIPYLEILKNDSKELERYAKLLEYNYINQLTHDGKPKPRKVDLFKRIKNKVRVIFR